MIWLLNINLSVMYSLLCIQVMICIILIIVFVVSKFMSSMYLIYDDFIQRTVKVHDSRISKILLLTRKLVNLCCWSLVLLAKLGSISFDDYWEARLGWEA